MTEMKVICARFNEERNWIEVVREITNDNGSVEYNGLSLHKERLEWISAEYEIDDVDELVELAIYSSFMSQGNNHEDVETARQQRRAGLLTTKQRLGPMRPSAGKPVLKSRLRDAGFTEKFITAVDDDAFDVIKNNSRMDPEKLNFKRQRIRARRNGQKIPTLPPTRKPEVIIEDVISNKLETIELRGGKRVRRNDGQKSV